MDHYLPDYIRISGNFSLNDFVNIVDENRARLHWFVPSVEGLIIAAYAIVIAFGVISNGLICFAIGTKKQLRTVRNMFIANLAVSDMILCSLCTPFTLLKLLLKNWPLGGVMCRLVPWLQAVNVFASTMTITAIARDRYHIIVGSSTVSDTKKKRNALTVIILIWLSAVLVGLPLLVFSKVEQKEYIHFVSYHMCMEEWPNDALRFAYASIVMTLQFVVPITILAFLYWKICNFLKTRITRNPTSANELNRAVKEANRHRRNSLLLMTIAVMFTLCWFPLTLLNLLADLDYLLFMHRNFLSAFTVAHLVAMMSACLNPILYGWFNSNFRRELTRLMCICCSKQDNMENAKLMERARLMAGIQARGKIVPKRQVNYKAVQTEFNHTPILVCQDSPHKDSVGLLTY